MNNNPIGVFDSGIGGLTVVREIVRLLPHENITYLGDTARVPYGSRGRDKIAEFALQLASFLIKKDVKILVVACNTISATCLREVQKISPVPVIGVIRPATKKIVETTKTGRVGIIGTRATINSKIYEEEIHEINPKISVTSVACPLFVPIAEEGLSESEIALLTARYYMDGLENIDTLHLGCTHYPLLKNVIQQVIGEEVAIIDSAIPTAQEVRDVLTEKNLLNEGSHEGSKIYYVTDAPERAVSAANLFLGSDIAANIRKINL